MAAIRFLGIRPCGLGAVLAAGVVLSSSLVDAQTLTAAAISETSDTYMLAVGWSNVLRATGAGPEITPLSGGGTVRLIRGVATGQWDIGFISAPHYSQALAGRGNFEQDPPELRAAYESVRALFGITSGMGHYVVRADSGIETIADLRGRTVSVGQPGGGGSRITPILFRHHGAEAETDYNVVYLTDEAALDEMRNNRVDAAAVWGGVPQPLIYNFSRQFPVRFLSLTPEGFEAFQQEMPGGDTFVLRTFTADALRQEYGDALVQEGDVSFFTFPMQVIVRAEMPEEIAYTIVRTFWENLDDVKRIGAALSNLDPLEGLEGLSAELHPGAARYYRERGWLN